jgi:uncharacterized repeat protein (TIGR03803 family)
MKTKLVAGCVDLRRHLPGGAVLAAGLALVLATSSRANPVLEPGSGPVPVFTLHRFGAVTNDGLHPAAGMIQGVDSNFYGTTIAGGSNNGGTIFAIGRGIGYTNLFSFTGLATGFDPEGGLAQGTNGHLYGTTTGGGVNNSGTVFRLSSTGVFSNLHSFAGSDGALPRTSLTWFNPTGSNSVLLGTAYAGGASNLGALFQITPGGVFTTLHSFAGSALNDGANPYGKLTVGQDGWIYGTTYNGGASNAGMVFAFSPQTGIGTNLYSFTGGNDGANPRGHLAQDDDGDLYGTTVYGGANGFGTVFKLKAIPAGTTTVWAFTNLYSFSGAWRDGGYPECGLVKGHDGHFYGTTSGVGGVSNNGTLFKISEGGRYFTLHRFGGLDGARPAVRLEKGWDGFLYGTTMYGGTNDAGTIFRTPCPLPRLLYLAPNGLLASWILNSTGGFENAVLHGNIGGWDIRGAGDIDGAGVADWVFQNPAGDVAVWFMNPDGTVRDAQIVAHAGAWKLKVCADMDGLGRAQYFFEGPTGWVAKWVADTNGLFQSLSYVYTGDQTWKLKGAVDLAGEGKAHLIWQRDDGVTYAWIHEPDGVTIKSVLVGSVGRWALCGAGDIEGEGFADLVWQTPDGNVGGWFMNTNVTARAATFWWNTGAWKLKGISR